MFADSIQVSRKLFLMPFLQRLVSLAQVHVVGYVAKVYDDEKEKDEANVQGFFIAVFVGEVFVQFLTFEALKDDFVHRRFDHE